MGKEKYRFLLKQRIREPRNTNGEIIDLEKELELEVNWIDQNMEKTKKQIIKFEKDGKKYRFELETDIKKDWFKGHVWSCRFGASVKLAEQNFWLENTGDKERIVPLQTRTTRWFFVGGFLSLLFLGIGTYFFWNKKRSNFF